MTRLEQIRFIEENSTLYKNTDWSRYSDTDVFRVYMQIPLPPDKYKKRSKEGGFLFYYWGTIADKLPHISRDDASFNYPWGIITFLWLVLFNPLCVLLYITFGLIILGHYLF